MSYIHLDFDGVQPRTLRKVLSHIDCMLADLYTFFKLEPEKQGGTGNFTVPLVLCCLLDSLAVDVWPTKAVMPNQEQRFKHLIRERLPYCEVADWVEKGLAAKVLYLELRNSLVHQAGQDVPTSARQKGMQEIGIGKWGRVPEDQRDIHILQDLDEWPEDWPILAIREEAEFRWYDLSDVSLYWAVKKLVRELMEDGGVMTDAVDFHKAKYVQTGSRPPGYREVPDLEDSE